MEHESLGSSISSVGAQSFVPSGIGLEAASSFGQNFSPQISLDKSIPSFDTTFAKPEFGLPKFPSNVSILETSRGPQSFEQSVPDIFKNELADINLDPGQYSKDFTAKSVIAEAERIISESQNFSPNKILEIDQILENAQEVQEIQLVENILQEVESKEAVRILEQVFPNELKTADQIQLNQTHQAFMEAGVEQSQAIEIIIQAAAEQPQLQAVLIQELVQMGVEQELVKEVISQGSITIEGEKVTREQFLKLLIAQVDLPVFEKRFVKGMESAKIALENAQKDGRDFITGIEILELMPSETDEVKSQIIKMMQSLGVDINDGSYPGYLEAIGNLGEIKTEDQLRQKLHQANLKNRPVMIDEKLIADPVAQKEVEKVVKGGKEPVGKFISNPPKSNQKRS